MLTDGQIAIRREAIDFACRRLGGSFEGIFDDEAWQALAEFGALAVTVAAEFGGRGASLAEFVAMMEGLGQETNRVGALFAVNAQVFGAIEPIRLSGTKEQQARYLPKLASGACARHTASRSRRVVPILRRLALVRCVPHPGGRSPEESTASPAERLPICTSFTHGPTPRAAPA